MSQPGWYTDPSGQPGMFRWWDGSGWTIHVTPNQFSPAPGQTPATPGAPAGSLPIREAQAAGQPPAAYSYTEIDQRSSKLGPALAMGLIGLLVIGLIVGGWYLLSGRIGAGSDTPASNPTSNVCPTVSFDPSATASPHTNPAGRVQGGQLSYPRLGSPWGAVTEDYRVPFGRDAYGQSVMVQENYDGKGSSWVASLLVGELVAGDGFFSPQQGSEIVTRCVLGVFYADAPVQRQDVVSQATTVDGKDAWVTEMHLGFSIPGLKETGETAIIVIVATSDESSSLYYASIPDSQPTLLQTAREVQSQLRVEA